MKYWTVISYQWFVQVRCPVSSAVSLLLCMFSDQIFENNKDSIKPVKKEKRKQIRIESNRIVWNKFGACKIKAVCGGDERNIDNNFLCVASRYIMMDKMDDLGV